MFCMILFFVFLTCSENVSVGDLHFPCDKTTNVFWFCINGSRKIFVKFYLFPFGDTDVTILRLWAFVLIQTHKGYKKKEAIYYVKTQHTNFQGNPLLQATKQHLNSEK